MRKKDGEERTPAEDSTLLRQPDLGGGQRPAAEEARPKGTHPVSAFAGAGCGPPGASGAWHVAPGEAEAAAEDGVPGSNAVRFSDAREAGVFAGEAYEPAVMVGPGELHPEVVRGALYEGPERRKHQAAWEQWQARDRRERPFVYAGDMQV
jgi:hypothetical protein